MGSSVGRKGEVWWVRVALAAGTRQVVAMVAADRSGSTARCLRDAPPDDDRPGAIAFGDFWAASAAVVPESQQIRRGKGDGMTSHVGRFRCTVRPRCARSVRKTLSCSR